MDFCLCKLLGFKVELDIFYFLVSNVSSFILDFFIFKSVFCGVFRG